MVRSIRSGASMCSRNRLLAVGLGMLFAFTCVVSPARAATGTLVFSDSFSNLDNWNLWNHADDFTPWTLDSSMYVSAPYSLSHTPYTILEGSLASTKNLIDLRTATSATLRFKAWYNTEADPDTIKVYACPDRLDEWGNPVEVCVAKLSGSSGGAFLPQTVDLSAFAGEQIRLQFFLWSDAAADSHFPVQTGGVRIDDVQVWKDGVGTSDTAPSGARITRTPAGSSKSYKRKKGTARYTLAAVVRAGDGSPVQGLKITLQTSKNGKTKWKNSYALVTNANGAVSKKFAVRKKGTTYYRWVASGAPTTGKQKIVVK
jgi:hypothetical protein